MCSAEQRCNILRVESSWQAQRVTAGAEALSRIIITGIDSSCPAPPCVASRSLRVGHSGDRRWFARVRGLRVFLFLSSSHNISLSRLSPASPPFPRITLTASHHLRMAHSSLTALGLQRWPSSTLPSAWRRPSNAGGSTRFCSGRLRKLQPGDERPRR